MKLVLFVQDYEILDETNFSFIGVSRDTMIVDFRKLF